MFCDTEPREAVSTSKSIGTENLYFFPVVAKQIPIRLYYSVGTGRYGEVYFDGFIENISSQPVYSVTLTINITGINPPGSFTFSVTPGFASTLPGQPNPFVLYTDILQFSKYDVEVTTWGWDSSEKHAQVAIVSEYEEWSCQFLVSGEIRNDQASSLRDVRVLVRPILDYVGYGDADLKTDFLGPGESTFYTAQHFDSTGCSLPFPDDFF